MLSIIVPCLNEQDNIKLFYNEINKKINNTKFEIIFIDDGSNDSTWDEISNLCTTKNNIKGIKLTRNFGKDEAILAALSNLNSLTKYAITLDCDLQYDPSYINKMLDIIKNKNVRIVEGIKTKSDIPFVSKIFNKIFSSFTGINFNQNSYLKLIDREVINYIINFKENNIFYRGLIAWTGFKTYKITIKLQKREKGKSRYNLKKLIILGLNAVTSFSFVPLVIICIVGFVYIAISTLMAIRIIYLRFFYDLSDGYATLFVLVSTSTSIIIFLLAIISLYLSKIYLETKARPKYIIDEFKNYE